jgi:hypothetical protein
MVNLEGSCIGLAANSGTLRIPSLANESTPRFNELMCAVGKLLVAFNILEQEIKTATCFLVNPEHPDLYSQETANRKRFPDRIEILKKRCAERLSLEDQVRINVLLDQTKALADVRNFPAHSLVYSLGDGEFLFQKFAKKFESQVGTPEEMIAKVKQLQTGTDEFAVLFQRLFPSYSSWYRRSDSQK